MAQGGVMDKMQRYWLRRDYLWEMNKGPLTRIDQTEEVYLAADVERVFTPLLQKIVGNSFEDSWVNDDLMNEAKALLAQLKQ